MVNQNLLDEVNMKQSKNNPKANTFVTRGTNGQRFTQAETEMAKVAYKFLENACFPSKEQAIELITSGNIRNIPFTKKDLLRAYELFWRTSPAHKRKHVAHPN